MVNPWTVGRNGGPHHMQQLALPPCALAAPGLTCAATHICVCTGVATSYFRASCPGVVKPGVHMLMCALHRPCFS